MSFVRVQQTARVPLTRTFYVDETPTSPTGTVTVTIRRLDGTSVQSGNATPVGPAGQFSFLPDVPVFAALDSLTADWSGTIAGASLLLRDYIEVCGGYLFGLADARNELQLPATWSAAKLVRHRIDVEDECEEICGQSFVPRFARVALNGTGREFLVLPRIKIRALRSVTVDGTALSSTELERVGVRASGVLVHPTAWPSGNRNIIVEFEHGLDFPPPLLSGAAILRLQSKLSAPISDVPPRALSFTVREGGTYRLTLPTGETTGIPDVDAVYGKYTVERGGFA